VKERFAFEEIQDYLSCSLLYYLKYRAKAEPLAEAALTTADLPSEAVAQALGVYASGTHPEMSFPELVRAVWTTWMRQKGIGSDTLTMLLGYEALRSQIMGEFLSGKIKKKGGRRYIEPRLAARYRQMIEHAGLIAAAERIEDYLREPFGVAPAALERIGEYRMADAYADSLLMAERYPLPARGSVIGAGRKVVVRSGNGIEIAVMARLLLRGESGLLAVTHLPEPVFYFDPTWAGRSLEAIALSMYGGEAEGVGPVQQVLIRHLMSGQTVARRQLRTSRLSLSLLHAARGIQAELYLPQFLSGDLGRCRRCPAASLCLDREEDPIEAAYPGTLGWGERVTAAGEQMGIGEDPGLGDLVQILAGSALTPQDLARYMESREDSGA
jgi:hypothetical protein